MCKSNAVVSAYTWYRHLQQYCSHPSNYYIYLSQSHERQDITKFQERRQAQIYLISTNKLCLFLHCRTNASCNLGVLVEALGQNLTAFMRSLCRKLNVPLFLITQLRL